MALGQWLSSRGHAKLWVRLSEQGSVLPSLGFGVCEEVSSLGRLGELMQ